MIRCHKGLAPCVHVKDENQRDSCWETPPFLFPDPVVFVAARARWPDTRSGPAEKARSEARISDGAAREFYFGRLKMAHTAETM